MMKMLSYASGENYDISISINHTYLHSTRDGNLTLREDDIRSRDNRTFKKNYRSLMERRIHVRTLSVVTSEMCETCSQIFDNPYHLIVRDSDFKLLQQLKNIIAYAVLLKRAGMALHPRTISI